MASYQIGCGSMRRGRARPAFDRLPARVIRPAREAHADRSDPCAKGRACLCASAHQKIEVSRLTRAEPCTYIRLRRSRERASAFDAECIPPHKRTLSYLRFFGSTSPKWVTTGAACRRPLIRGALCGSGVSCPQPLQSGPPNPSAAAVRPARRQDTSFAGRSGGTKWPTMHRQTGAPLTEHAPA